MAFLNVNIGILSALDAVSNQPNLRLADLRYNLQGLKTDNVQNFPISLAPGESTTILSNQRSLSISPSTTIVVSQTPKGLMRLQMAIGQRTSRAAGDNTTQWTLGVTGQIVTLTATGGTISNLSLLSPNDQVALGSDFSPTNQGSFRIMAFGSNYVEFINPYASPQIVTATNNSLSIYSSGPVQVGDVVDISSQAFAYPNQGSFPVVNVTDQYIDVVNPNLFPQTVTNVTSGFVVYPFCYQWMFLVVDNKSLVGLNGDTPSVVVEPPVEGDQVRNPGIMLKRGKTFEITVVNIGSSLMQGFLLLAE